MDSSAFTLYDGSVPHIVSSLKVLQTLLDKIEEHAQANSTPVEDLLAARLIPDMLPFTFQIHSSTDTAQKMASRLLGTEPEQLSKDDLTTLADCRKRVEWALERVSSADKAKIDARVNEVVPLGLGPGKNIELKAKDYVGGYALPNIFFHVNMAYAILRAQGVKVGKMSYLTPFIGPHAGNI